MNRSEASSLLNRTARQWAGQDVTINRSVLDTWANALADMTAEQGEAAYAAHVADPDRGRYAATPADLWAAHRALAGDPHARPRPEIARPALSVAGPHEAPDMARGELAKMRAILGTAHPYDGRRR